MPLTTVCNTHLLRVIGLTYVFMLYLDNVFVIVFRGLKLNIRIIILHGYCVILIFIIVAFGLVSVNCPVT